MKRSSTKPVEMADNNVRDCVFYILQRLSLLPPLLMLSSEKCMRKGFFAQCEGKERSTISNPTSSTS